MARRWLRRNPNYVALQCCRADLLWQAHPTSGKERSVIDIGQLGCEPTCSTEKENVMASPTTLSTPYLQRLELVSDTIKTHSELADKAASELAVHVLHALNSIPEKMR